MAKDPRVIHGESIKKLVPSPKNIDFFNNLITLYSNFNLNSSALKLFFSIPCPNTVTWTSIISAFVNSPTAISLFLSMLRHNPPPLPNARTFATLLKTCASLSPTSLCRQLHSLAFKLAVDENPFVASGFVSVYCKTPDMGAAVKVFDEMSERDEVCYAAIINGFARNNRPTDALRYFVEMRRQGVGSTSHSVSGALCAVSSTARLDQCMVIHDHAIVSGWDSDEYVKTALIDGYGKSGLIEEARKLFEGKLNIAAWNAMMAAYAQQGSHESVIELFISMESREIAPDSYSFLAVLTALSNAGMVSETEKWLSNMKLQYKLEPQIEHYTCLVGALARKGRLEEAEKVALAMPYQPDAAVWRTMLSSCVNNANSELAKRVSKKLRDINPDDDSAYVILANASASARQWNEVKEIWKIMRDMRVKKEVGRSWIEVKGKVHVFFAGDRKHERMEEIYAKLSELMMKIDILGYVPRTSEALHDIDKEDKKEMLWCHSEKLAVAFGLLTGVTPIQKPLRVVKNLKICGDCHHVFKYISTVENREIIVRDAHRYHRFLKGNCSCGDTW